MCYHFYWLVHHNRHKQTEIQETILKHEQKEKVYGFIAGPSGVGKGYGVGSPLTEYFGTRIFVTGDWCREHQKTLADQGLLVNDKHIHYAVESDFKIHHENHFLIDAPRSEAQVHDFLAMFRKTDSNARLVTFHIDGPREHCEARLRDRAVRQGRLDDASPEVIEARLGKYFCPGGIRDTLIPVLRSHTEFYHIDGWHDLEKVRDEVIKIHGPKAFGVGHKKTVQRIS